MKIKTGVILFFFLALLNAVCAQSDKAKSKKDFWQKVYFGGNMGLQFGTVTFLDISPLAGYKITEKLSAGVGITYQYFSVKAYHYATERYGGRVFGRFNITENLFAYTEYELLNIGIGGTPEKRINIANVFVGGGYSQPLGAKSSLNVLVLWNINESVYSPYQNPIIRAGINIGL